MVFLFPSKPFSPNRLLIPFFFPLTQDAAFTSSRSKPRLSLIHFAPQSTHSSSSSSNLPLLFKTPTTIPLLFSFCPFFSHEWPHVILSYSFSLSPPLALLFLLLLILLFLVPTLSVTTKHHLRPLCLSSTAPYPAIPT